MRSEQRNRRRARPPIGFTHTNERERREGRESIAMINKNSHTPNHVPIRFEDEEERRLPNQATDENEGHATTPTADELGRASSYEDATEMQRRIDRGAEKDDVGGRGQANDADTSGGPDPSELPESREDRDTKPPLVRSQATESHPEPEAGSEGDQPRRAGAASGPMLAELVATRSELRRIEGALQKVTQERQDLLDRLARRQADFDNYRKRVERERGDTYARVVGEVISHLLPAMDNLQRALDVEASGPATESEEFRHFLSGVELIGKQLNGVLETLEVKPVATVGEKFDPRVHEAIATEQSDDFAPDTVIQEVVRGYRLGEKLLRPAMVKVAK